MLRRAAALLVLLAASSGCLVVSLQPAYDDESLGWDPALIGTWQSLDDETTIQIERDEWESYRVHYRHPIEAGELTGYLTTIGDDRFLDLAPERGQDRGAFLVPVHALARVRLVEGRLEVTPLSYDWFLDRARKPGGIPGLAVTIDQRQNVLVVSPSAAVRGWLRKLPPGSPAFGATTIFARK